MFVDQKWRTFESNLFLHLIRRLRFNNGSIKIISHDFAYSVTVDGSLLMHNTSRCRIKATQRNSRWTWDWSWDSSLEELWATFSVTAIKVTFKSYLVLKVVAHSAGIKQIAVEHVSQMKHNLKTLKAWIRITSEFTTSCRELWVIFCCYCVGFRL